MCKIIKILPCNSIYILGSGQIQSSNQPTNQPTHKNNEQYMQYLSEDEEVILF